MPTKVLFVGGGSLGHIVPSVAVWEALQKIDQSAQAHFVCLPTPLETEFLQAEQLPYSTITAPRFGLSFLWKFWKAVRQSNAILDAVQPDVIFSKGGYVSVPLC